MTFRPEPDTAVADWWLAPEVVDDWGVVATHGPAGFAAYVRVRQHDDEERADWVLRDVAEVLAGATGTPDDVVVALWDGNLGEGGARCSLATGRVVAEPSPFADDVLRSPRAVLADGRGPVREYVLLRGRLDELGAWPARDPERPPGVPELVCGATWPEDRAWFHAWEVDDDHGATIACDDDLAAALLADGRYAAWRVRRGEPDPPERLRPAR